MSCCCCWYQDAAWVAFNNSLKVSSLSHVFLLLKSSDFVAHDLTRPFQLCADAEQADTAVDYCLGRRNWRQIFFYKETVVQPYKILFSFLKKILSAGSTVLGNNEGMGGIGKDQFRQD